MTTATSAGALATQANQAAESGRGPIIAAPHLHVVVLAPDASMDFTASSGTAGSSGSSHSWVDVRRTVNLGDVGALSAPGLMRPDVFAVDGNAPAAGEPASNDPAEATQATTPAPTPSGSAGQYVLSLPADPRMEVQGAFDPAAGFVAFQIPVGPMTQSVRFVLHPPVGLPDDETPIFGQVSLLGPSGRPLAEIDPDANIGGQLPQDLTVAMQNAPAGGQLVVRVTGATTQGVAGSQSLSTLQSNLPFLLDIQSQNEPTLDTQAPSAAEPGPVGTVAVRFAPLAGQSSQSSSSDTTEGPASEVALSNQATEIPPASVPVNDGGQDGEGYYVRMATGPLVSRSAGPLGPVLAASGVDLTPPVDRHERALLQEIPNLDRENEAQSSIDSIAAGRSAVVQRGEKPAQYAPRTGEHSVTVVLGAGGFPMKVTSRSSGDRAGLVDLLAAMPQPVEPPSSDNSPARSLAAAFDPPVELTADLSYPADRRGYPDYLRAACGLVLGLGLTSGPLFSDLITTLRKRTSRWRPTPRPGHRRG